MISTRFKAPNRHLKLCKAMQLPGTARVGIGLQGPVHLSGCHQLLPTPETLIVNNIVQRKPVMQKKENPFPSSSSGVFGSNFLEPPPGLGKNCPKGGSGETDRSLPFTLS